MALDTQPPESDLWIPLPSDGETWDPHTIHTWYFGFSIPEAAIGAFLYVRLMPAFPLSQGGVVLFQGLENRAHLDVAHLDYEMTMPWPAVEGTTATTANGLVVEFPEPGRVARVAYASPDGRTTLDVRCEAVTPLLARGHVMPGEEAHHDAARAPGGSEQFMHVTGELVLDGERHAVDCHAPRDRSWRQVRVERRDAVVTPPVCWTPMCFGPDRIFNQISFEALDTDPIWAGRYPIDPDRPTHHFAWLVQDDETIGITSVRRNVLEHHPVLHAATRQEVEATDDRGRTHRFHGEAIAMAPIPAWPNAGFCDSVYRWEDAEGRVTHATCQEIWFQDHQHRMYDRRRTTHAA